MRRALLATCVLLSLYAPARAGACGRVPSPTPTTVATPAAESDYLVIKGQILTVDARFVVFTTGDALRLASGAEAPDLHLGETVYLTVDRRTNSVTAVATTPPADALDIIEASVVPRELVAVDPRSLRSVTVPSPGPSGGPGTVVITIDVAVPDVTPPQDDIYLSTERTNFAAAELRMNRVDALDWTISLPLPSGSTLRYLFTRGSPSTIERTRSGSVVAPRELPATAGAHAHATVERWADRF